MILAMQTRRSPVSLINLHAFIVFFAQILEEGLGLLADVHVGEDGIAELCNAGAQIVAAVGGVPVQIVVFLQSGKQAQRRTGGKLDFLGKLHQRKRGMLYAEAVQIAVARSTDRTL